MNEIPHPSTDDATRPGEVTFAFDPAGRDDARLCFIGRVVSPWRERRDCPKNIREARERDHPAVVEIDEAFRPALAGLGKGGWLHVVTWLHGARRDLAVQAPRHSKATHGTFALRSPVRPNPIGLHLVRVVSIDPAAGRIVVDAIDVLDGTPVLDLKPYFETVDRPPTET